MADATTSARATSRRDVARRALEDPDLREILHEFRRRHFTAMEEYDVWCDYAERVIDVATRRRLL